MRMPLRRFDDTGVICSTLPSLPGMTVILAKSIIFGTSSVAYTADAGSQSKANELQKQLSSQLAPLLAQGHAQLKQQAAAMGCNAVLAVTFNITKDIIGQYTGGYYKSTSVTVCGTPCYLVVKKNKN